MIVVCFIRLTTKKGQFKNCRRRYIAVCHPQKYRSLNLSINNVVRVVIYVVPVTLASVSLNLPKFFEAKVQQFCAKT